MTPTLTGTLVGDRYRLVARALDRGAGETWRAEDTRRQGAQVSVKFLRAVEGDELSPALVAAVRALKVFRHDAVPAVLAHGLLGRRPWIVFEELSGSSAGHLLDAARAEGSLVALEVLRSAIAAVIDAVRAAHEPPHPLFVGSVTPGAVIIPPKPVRAMGALLVDLGLHGHVDPPDDADPRSARVLIADAPELRGGAPTVRSDVFALGALLTELLAKPPEVGATAGQVSEARRRTDVPPAVWSALATALATDPGQRFASVSAMQRCLDAAWVAPMSPLQRLMMPSGGGGSLLDSVVVPQGGADRGPPSLTPKAAATSFAQPALAALLGPLPPLKPSSDAEVSVVPPTAHSAAPSPLARLLAPTPPPSGQGTPWDTNVLKGHHPPAPEPTSAPDDAATLVFAPAPPDSADGVTLVATKQADAPPAGPPAHVMNEPSGTLVASAASARAASAPPSHSLPAPMAPPAQAPTPVASRPQALSLLAWTAGGGALLLLAIAAFLWGSR